MSLLVVGTVAFDKVETPFGKTDRMLGGAGTYAALAASMMTREIKLVSVVGGDFPDEYMGLFTQRGIDTTAVEVIPHGKTFFWEGVYHCDMNCRTTLTTELNVLAGFDPVLPEDHRRCQFVFLGNLTPRIQRQVIDQMKEKPLLVCMDTMNFWMNTALNDLLDVISRVDLLTVNDEEARQLSGEYALSRAARKILSMGPRYLIIKKGEHGALLFSESEMCFVPALLLDYVEDPTGAGDAFAGGLMGFLARHQQVSFETIRQALLFGTVMASFAVSGFGTSSLQKTTSNDVEQALNRLIRMTKCDFKHPHF